MPNPPRPVRSLRAAVLPAFSAGLLLLIATATTAAPVTRTLEPQHRTPEEIAAIVRPLAGEAAVIAAGNALVIRGEAAVVEEMARVVQRLDAPAQRLRLTIRQGGSAESLAGGVHATPEARVYGTTDRDAANLVQTITVTEGAWARIEEGRSIPYVSQSAVVGPGGAVVQQGTEYKDVGSGFEVRPRVRGDTVHVDVRAWRANLARDDGGVIETHTVHTTLEGRLGDWLTLAGQDSLGAEDDRGIVYSTRSRATTARVLQIRIERLP